MTSPPLAEETPFGRRYRNFRTGEVAISVTTALKSFHKKEIEDWKFGMAAKLDGWDEMATWHPSVRKDALIAASEDYTEERALIGTIVHETVESIIKGVPVEVPKEAASYIGQFGKFVMDKRPEFTHSEVTVWSRTLGYAGTADIIMKIGGKTVLADVKCLARDVLVTMADGSERLAADIHHGDLVAAWDEQGEKVVPARVSASGDNGVQPVFQVNTKCGRSVRVTAEHPFLTRRGWVKAVDLQPGSDVVRTAAADPGAGDYDLDRAYFLGVTVGDGSIRRYQTRITTIDPLVVEFLHKFAAQEGMSVSSDKDISYYLVNPDGVRRKNPITAFLRSTGLTGTTAATKFIPDEIMKGGTEAWKHFLAGYLDSDGCVRGEHQGTGRCGVMVSWTSKSRKLVRQCQSLLTGLGVRSSLYPVHVHYKGERRRYWNLAVRDRTALRVLQGIIPIRSGRTLKLKESNIPPRSVKDTNTGTLPWDLVVSVEEQPAEPTVWIEVADYHTHITGGIVTHNTGKNAHPENGMQVAALKYADFIIDSDCSEHEIPQIDQLAVLHLRPRGWKLIPIRREIDCFKAFCGALELARWKDEVADHVLGEAAL